LFLYCRDRESTTLNSNTTPILSREFFHFVCILSSSSFIFWKTFSVCCCCSHDRYWLSNCDWLIIWRKIWHLQLINHFVNGEYARGWWLEHYEHTQKHTHECVRDFDHARGHHLKRNFVFGQLGEILLRYTREREWERVMMSLVTVLASTRSINHFVLINSTLSSSYCVCVQWFV